MKIKKKLVLLLTVVAILAGISTVAFAIDGYVPPLPIRDSIVQEY